MNVDTNLVFSLYPLSSAMSAHNLRNCRNDMSLQVGSTAGKLPPPEFVAPSATDGKSAGSAFVSFLSLLRCPAWVLAFLTDVLAESGTKYFTVSHAAVKCRDVSNAWGNSFMNEYGPFANVIRMHKNKAIIIEHQQRNSAKFNSYEDLDQKRNRLHVVKTHLLTAIQSYTYCLDRDHWFLL